jgi:thioredoxin-like negative regulator of GroEL
MGFWPAAGVLVLAVAVQQRPSDPAARLNFWLTAVDRHQPGTTDSYARVIGQWPRHELLELAADLGIFLDRLADTRDTKSPRRSIPQTPRRRSSDTVNAIRAVAADALKNGVADALLKRGALLHADVAMLVPAAPAPVTAPQPLSADPRQRRHQTSPPGRVIVQTEDGVALDLELNSLHWDIGRMVIDSVSPDPSRDETARLWYRATLAYLLREEHFGDAYPHVTAALDAVAGDARLLFYAGTLHETFASGSVQAAARAVESRTNMRSEVRSVEDELEDAAKYFRRSLDADRNLHEARLHLGRVVGLLGRHEEAVAALRQTIPELKDPRLVYYGEMFLGYEEAAMRRRQAAQEHFGRAAALFPQAQSPHLALSHMARAYGDRPAALRAVKQIYALPPHEQDRQDPWWLYHKSHVQDADALLARLRRPFLTNGKP